MPNRRLISTQILILTWLISSIAIHKQEILKNGLQARMVYTMSQYHTFVLARSAANAPPPRGDLVEWNQNILPFKQPGIALLGSIPFLAYKAYANLDGTTEFAIVCAFTAGLANALICCLIFLILSRLGFGLSQSIFPAIICATGTTLAAYSGTIHHDPVSTFIVFLSFYLLMFSTTSTSNLRFLFAGLLLGISIFVSLLPIAIISIVFCWGFLKSGIQKGTMLIIGSILGLLPTIIYQWLFFDSAFRTPSHAYAIKNGTKIIAGSDIMLSRFMAYFSPTGSVSLFVFMPICVLGIIGLGIVAAKKDSPYSQHALPLLLVILAHAVFLIIVGGGNTISRGGFGDCQFGPRYWITAVPFMCLGLGFLLNSFPRSLIPTLLLATWSILVNQAGLHLGTMYCGNGNLLKQFNDYMALYLKKDLGVLLLPNLITIQCILLAITVLIRTKSLPPKTPGA